jgi:hypothetical protein
MNERVKELSRQAGFELNPVHFDHEKFALLIVQECIAQAHAVSELRGITEDMKYGADISAVLIARHFGVNNETK